MKQSMSDELSHCKQKKSWTVSFELLFRCVYDLLSRTLNFALTLGIYFGICRWLQGDNFGENVSSSSERTDQRFWKHDACRHDQHYQHYSGFRKGPCQRKAACARQKTSVSVRSFENKLHWLPWSYKRSAVCLWTSSPRSPAVCSGVHRYSQSRPRFRSGLGVDGYVSKHGRCPRLAVWWLSCAQHCEWISESSHRSKTLLFGNSLDQCSRWKEIKGHLFAQLSH